MDRNISLGSNCVIPTQPAEPNICMPLVVVVAILMALVQWMYHQLVEANRQIQDLEDTMDLMAVQNEKDVELERNKGRVHILKMKMLQRDHSSRVGGLHRKLREKNSAMETLLERVAMLQCAKEDITQIVDDLIRHRELLRVKENIIMILQEQVDELRDSQKDINALFGKRRNVLGAQVTQQSENVPDENKEN